jgi:integrase
MNVTLRQRQKGDKISLYLDYYSNGKRKYEYLELYLTPDPEKGKLSNAVKEENKKMLLLAETIRSKRHLEIQNSTYDFHDKEKLKTYFIMYMQALAEKRKDSKGNYGNWDSTIKHLKKYCPKDIQFNQINKQFVDGFREYLQREATSKTKKAISINTKYSYFNKFRAALKQAVRDGIIKTNPAEMVEGLPQGEPVREFLTLEEVKALAKTECKNELIKKTFLFACLTGLRFSDIQKLKWSEVQQSEELGHYIRFVQQKTKGSETLPISEEAFGLIKTERGNPNDLVFPDMIYSDSRNMDLHRWIMKAGIEKHITFHCSRHTYATLQLTLGTDIFTVSKLLGHRHLKTTQIYANVIDEKKTVAANRIKIGI